jgi:hypothetical protein
MSRPIADELRTTPWNLVQCLFRAGKRREMVAWRQLLLAARGAEDVAGNLVTYELERSPWLTRREAIEAASRRLEADRSR